MTCPNSTSLQNPTMKVSRFTSIVAMVPIENFGDSFFTSHSSFFRLHNLLHVPSITKNLIFVCADNQCFFEFHSNFFYVKDKSTRMLLISDPTCDGLYQFSPPSSSTAPSTLLGERTTWPSFYGVSFTRPALKLFVLFS